MPISSILAISEPGTIDREGPPLHNNDRVAPWPYSLTPDRFVPRPVGGPGQKFCFQTLAGGRFCFVDCLVILSGILTSILFYSITLSWGTGANVPSDLVIGVGPCSVQ